MIHACLFCGGDASEPDHLARCDGRQGAQELVTFKPRALETQDFDGETYVRPRDGNRIESQFGRVLALMKDARWRTLAEIAGVVGSSEAGVSARLRDLRKRKFGGHLVERRYLHDGLWEYRLTVVRQTEAAS